MPHGGIGICCQVLGNMEELYNLKVKMIGGSEGLWVGRKLVRVIGKVTDV
jgi:hypothetical protein